MMPICYTIKDAMKASGLGRTTLYKLMDEGRLEFVKVETRRLIRCDSLEKLLAPEPTSTSAPNMDDQRRRQANGRYKERIKYQKDNGHGRP